MTARRVFERTTGPVRQRGAAMIIMVTMLLALVSLMAVEALNMAGSDTYDTAAQNDAVEALFLAEGAVERAIKRYGTGTLCGGLADAVTNPFGGGANTSFTVTALGFAGVNCRIQARGVVRSSARTIQADMSAGGGTITFGNASSSAGKADPFSFAHTVPANTSILLVGISIDRGKTTIMSVTHGAGQTLSQLGEVSASGSVEASIWYRVNPAAGSANIVVDLSASEEIVVGAVSFLGVNTTAPFNPVAMSSSSNTTGTAAPISITPGVSGAWVFEVVAVDGDPTVNINSPLLANQVQRWDLQFNGKVSGGGSTIGPITPASAQSPNWTWSGSKKWAHAAAALQPAGSPQLVRWSEVVN